MNIIKITLFLYLLLVSPVFAEEAGGTLFYANQKKRLDGGFDLTAGYAIHDKIHPTIMFNHYMRGIRNREYGVGCKYLFTPRTNIMVGGIYNYDRDIYQVIIRFEHTF